MKRLLVIIIISAILALALTGCGGDSGSELVSPNTKSPGLSDKYVDPKRADPQEVVEKYLREMGSKIGEDYYIANVEEVSSEEIIFTIHSYSIRGKSGGIIYVWKMVLKWEYVACAWGWRCVEHYDDGMIVY